MIYFSRSINIAFIIFFHLKGCKSLKNVSGYKFSEVSSLFNHQYKVREVIQRSKQSSDNHLIHDISSTKGGQLIGKSSESAVDRTNLFTFIALEPMKFASEGVN